jgi:hypothetical protein
MGSDSASWIEDRTLCDGVSIVVSVRLCLRQVEENSSGKMLYSPNSIIKIAPLH